MNSLAYQSPRPSLDAMGSFKNALAIKNAQNTLTQQPIQQAREAKRFQWEEEDRAKAKAIDPVIKMTSFTQFVRDQAPSIKWQNYPQAREYLAGIAEDLEIPNFGLPAPEEIEQEAINQGVAPEEYFETWKDNALRTAESRIKEMTAQKGLINASKPKTPTTAMGAYLQQNPNASPDEMALFAQKLKGKGIEVTLPDGTSITVGGAAGGADMTKKTKGAIETKIMGGKELLARMESISNEFKPEYQEIGTRLRAAWTGVKARLGMDVSDEDAKVLTGFKKFQRKAIENINLYIKEMTGAQMSEKEASRLRLAQPDPGESWWKGDDPITFKAKMDDVQLMTRAAIARFEYYRSKGFKDAQIKKLINSDEAVSLESIAAKME